MKTPSPKNALLVHNQNGDIVGQVECHQTKSGIYTYNFVCAEPNTQTRPVNQGMPYPLQVDQPTTQSHLLPAPEKMDDLLQTLEELRSVDYMLRELMKDIQNWLSDVEYIRNRIPGLQESCRKLAGKTQQPS